MLLGIAGLCAIFGYVPITILGFIFSVAHTSVSSAVASVAVAANANMLRISEIICCSEGCSNIALSIHSIRSSTWSRSVILVYVLTIPSTATAVPDTTAVAKHVPDAIRPNWISFLIVGIVVLISFCLIIGIVVLILLWFGLNGDYEFGSTHRGRFNLWMGPRDTHSRERFTSEEDASPRIR